MFFLKKLLIPFLLPPGIFIVLLLLSGLWFLFKKYWKAGVFNFFVGSLMWLFSISPLSDTMLRGLESDFTIPGNPEGDVIILLGGGAYEEVQDISGVGAPSESMLERIVTAVRLQKRLNIPVIVSGGAWENKKSEARIVKRFLIDLGVPEQKVIVEEKSRDTIENAQYTSEICKKNGYQKPLLVTSAFHIKRSLLSFEKFGIKAIPFPAGLKTWQDKKYGWGDYLPGPTAFEMSYTALREYAGLVFYRFVY